MTRFSFWGIATLSLLMVGTGTLWASGAPLVAGSGSPALDSTPIQFPPPFPDGEWRIEATRIAAVTKDLAAMDVSVRQKAVNQLYWSRPTAETAVSKLANQGSGEAAVLARRIIGMWQRADRQGGKPDPFAILERWDLSAWAREVDIVAMSRDANVRFMLRGYCYAASTTTSSGGFGKSDNKPLKVATVPDEQFGTVYLKAAPNEFAIFGGGYKGMTLHLVNGTDQSVSFNACDSRLDIVQEALDLDGQWKPIEYLPSSWCGNSYHTVSLEAGHEWKFKAPRYVGTWKTKLRFRLLGTGTRWPILSNEFEGSVNREQFSNKQGYRPKGVMDPYLD